MESVCSCVCNASDSHFNNKATPIWTHTYTHTHRAVDKNRMRITWYRNKIIVFRTIARMYFTLFMLSKRWHRAWLNKKPKQFESNRLAENSIRFRTNISNRILNSIQFSVCSEHSKFCVGSFYRIHSTFNSRAFHLPLSPEAFNPVPLRFFITFCIYFWYIMCQLAPELMFKQ